MASKLKTFFRYFPCSEQHRQWGFHVHSAGFSEIPAGHAYPPVAHPENHHFSWEKGRTLETFTFVYVPRGRGILETERTDVVEIVEGSLFIVYPGVWHRYKPLGATGWDEYWIEFGGEAAENFVRRSRLKADEPVLAVQDTTKIMDLFLDVVDLAKHQPYGFEFLLSSAAFSLLTSMIVESAGQNDEDREKAELTRKARMILLSDLDKHIDLKELAMELGMSYSLFRKMFKSITGFSPHQYRLNFKLHRAEQLLKSSDLQIGQITNALGFSSIYYFSELFKKKTGMSPSQFRTERGR